MLRFSKRGLLFRPNNLLLLSQVVGTSYCSVLSLYQALALPVITGIDAPLLSFWSALLYWVWCSKGMQTLQGQQSYLEGCF